MLKAVPPSKAWLPAATVAGAFASMGLPLFLVAVLTVALAALGRFANVDTVTTLYLIPVLVGALRGGVFAAVTTALVGLAVAAFFFYPPLYDFRVHSPVQIVDLVLFIIVAVVTGQLAANVRRAKLREQGEALREALIGSVSHELRTPLSTILGSASVLAQSPQIARDERLGPLVQGLREEAERLDGHIQNLIDASRISSEGIEPRSEWVDPADVVNAAVDRKRALLADRRVGIVVPEDLPLLRVDAALVERALGHLVENAAKYSPPGSPIEIAAGQDGAMVTFAVRDEGSGFAAEERDRIWERFYRSPRHGDIAGSGLGLWIARSLVEACGGRVEAFSAGGGRGATLSLHLPIPPPNDGKPDIPHEQ
jgi:K+-sensing histidine kinase KdpD